MEKGLEENELNVVREGKKLETGGKRQLRGGEAEPALGEIRFLLAPVCSLLWSNLS